MPTLGIGVYGANGHQLRTSDLEGIPAAIVAGAAVTDDLLTADARRHDGLGSLLADERVDLVSLCSPSRADQAADAIRCLEAGKAVFAEKPAALTEAELDAVLQTAERTGVPFREMNDAYTRADFVEMAAIVSRGEIGRVVQVHARKSYPLMGTRPVDETVDGGLIRWAGIHAFRAIEAITGLEITGTNLVASTGGDSVDSLVVAASGVIELGEDAVGSVQFNYLNPSGTGVWGNDDVQIVGTRGLVESTGGVRRIRLVVDDNERVIEATTHAPTQLALYVESLLGGPAIPVSADREVHATRVAIRADATARRPQLVR